MEDGPFRACYSRDPQRCDRPSENGDINFATATISQIVEDRSNIIYNR